MIKITGGRSLNIQIYDNSLRDGEQSVSVAYTTEEKKQIAKKLCEVGIKKFEAGFIAVSEYERKTIEEILTLNLPAQVFCLARLTKKDVDLAIEIGVQNITLFTCSSDALIKYKIKKEIDEIKSDIYNVVTYAKQKGMYVRFSCEGATETPIERLIEFYNIACECGADYISVPDTSGVAIPSVFKKTIYTLKENIPIPMSVHCHNDLGLATANSLAAIDAGADEIQTTVNGMGERAGNASLEEILAILYIYYDVKNFNLKEMCKLSELVEKMSGVGIPDHKPIVGKNAFCHESGLHVNALLAAKTGVYEPFPPEILGKTHSVAFGKHSGKGNIEYLANKMNISLCQEAVSEILSEVKKLSNKKVKVTSENVEELIKSKFFTLL